MSNESKMVPVALLRNIEMTWRQASGFSNAANSLIEKSLPELRELLAAPVPPQGDAQPVGEVVGKKFEWGNWMPQIKWANEFNPEITPIGSMLYTHADAGEAVAAVLTLQGQGYTYHGSQLWRPPIGRKPDFELIDTLRAQLADSESRALSMHRELHALAPGGYTNPDVLSATKEGQGEESGSQS